jgi:hypothetical protein
MSAPNSSTPGEKARIAALADDQVLYHVLHPANAGLDQWTSDYNRALDFFEQFVREYGQAHLHVQSHPAGQYDSECLLRTDTEEGA